MTKTEWMRLVMSEQRTHAEALAILHMEKTAIKQQAWQDRRKEK